MRTLGRLPGMAQGGLSAQSNIRGGETGELLTLLDGFPLREAFHLPAYHDVFGVLDPELIGEAEVYTGGFPVRYGNRMGGVFDLRTIDADAAPHTALGLSVFNAMARSSGVLEGPDLDWLAMARVGTLKPFIRAFADECRQPDLRRRLRARRLRRAGSPAPDGELPVEPRRAAISRESQGEQAQTREPEPLSVAARRSRIRQWRRGLACSRPQQHRRLPRRHHRQSRHLRPAP